MEINYNTEYKKIELEEKVVTLMEEISIRNLRLQELMKKIGKTSFGQPFESISSIEGSGEVEDNNETIVQLISKEKKNFNKRIHSCEESFYSLKAKISELADKSYEDETSAEAIGVTFDKFFIEENKPEPHRRVISQNQKPISRGHKPNTSMVGKTKNRRELRISFCKPIEDPKEEKYQRDSVCGKCIII